MLFPSGDMRLFNVYNKMCSARTVTHSAPFRRMSNILTSKEIRQTFIDYFLSNDHTFVPSSGVVLQNDPSILLVNSGMNQFKPIFLEHGIGSENRMASLRRAVNSQKCIRAGGKHCDLEQVGKDFYHHTFFEMLGNWSFGDYFKREACHMAWQLLTEVYQLPPDRLYVTYFAGDKKMNLLADHECRDIWRSIGIREDHLIALGSDSNFWEMGDKGPCGPCTEIHYDYLGSPVSEVKRRLNCGSFDTVELWNIVFMQYNRLDMDSIEPLPRHHVDTGMGFERLTSILQKKRSNYDTDLFRPLLEAIHKKASAKPYAGLMGAEHCCDTTYRMIADHARMITVAVSDGILPDKRNVGHLLRRVMRKVFVEGRTVLGMSPGCMCDLAEVVTSTLGDSYPELWENLTKVKNIIAEEEGIYFSLLDKTSTAFAKLAKKSPDGVLKGSDVFQLYVQSGLSEEQIEVMASKLNMKVDWEGFQECFAHRREKNVHVLTCKPETCNVSLLLKQKGISSTDDSFKYQRIYESGEYHFPDLQANILALFYENKMADKVQPGSICDIIMDRTNYYAEAGGQMGDKGVIVSDGMQFHVEKTEYSGNYVLHRGSLASGTLRVGDLVTLQISREDRQNCMKNHTASLLLHASLLQILPETIQKSVHITNKKFDLTFFAKNPLHREELQQVEDCVNAWIQKKMSVVTVSLPLASALQHKGLLSMEDKIYPDIVTMVTMGENGAEDIFRALSCGTLVENTSDIGSFAIISEKGVGATKRKIIAVTGTTAKSLLDEMHSLEKRTEALKGSVPMLPCEDLLNFKELNNISREIRSIRTIFNDKQMPKVKQYQLEDALHVLDRQCASALRKYYVTQFMPKVTAEWQRTLEEQSDKSFILFKMTASEDSNIVLKHLDKIVGNNPTLVFICNDVDTGTCKVNVKCWVPECCANEQFDAESWANHIIAFLGGQTQTYAKIKPELMCGTFLPVIISAEMLDEALCMAKQFVEKNMNQ